MVEIVSLAGSLAYAGEDRYAPVELSNVVDQLHDNNRFPHTGAPECPHFATFQKRAYQIDDFDARWENLRGSRLVHERWWRTMDRIVLFCLNWSTFIHRRSGHIEDTAHHPFTHGHG